MHILLAVTLLGASGDVLIKTKTATVVCSPGQRTNLGNHIAGFYPSVAIADLLSYNCTGMDRPSTAQCYPVVNETLTSAQLFSLLVAGSTVMPGVTTTARSKELPPAAYVGGYATAFRSFIENLLPETAGLAIRAAQCVQLGTTVRCWAEYAKPYSQAAAFAALQTGTVLEPLGMVP